MKPVGGFSSTGYPRRNRYQSLRSWVVISRRSFLAWGRRLLCWLSDMGASLRFMIEKCVAPLLYQAVPKKQHLHSNFPLPLT